MSVRFSWRWMRLARAALTFLGAAVGVVGWQLWVRGDGPRTMVFQMDSSSVVLDDAAAIRAFAILPSAAGPRFLALKTSGAGVAVRLIDTVGGERELPPSPLRRNGEIQALAAASDGTLYLYDSKAKVHVLNANGVEQRVFRVVRRPGSIAVLPSGEVAIGGPSSGKLIHVFAPDGRLIRRFGEVEGFVGDRVENNYLNEGIVLVDPAGNFIYVFQQALRPAFLTFSPDGRPIGRHVVDGPAVDFQLQGARRVVDEVLQERAGKKSCTVGAVRIVNAAGIDPATGHLWIALNGLATSGLLYEFDAVTGTKVAEHRFEVPDQPVVSVRAVAFGSDGAYVQLDDGRLRRVSNSAIRVSELGGPLGRLARGWARLRLAPVLPVVQAQLPCPPNNGPLEGCISNCTNNSKNCTAALKAALPPSTTHSYYDPYCNVSGLNCEAANSTCWKANGIRGRTEVGGACVPCTPCSGPGWVENTEYCSNPDEQDECGCCFRDNSPIFIEMGGAGFPFSSAQEGVLFETNAAGTVRRLAWPLRPVEEPWLAWDRNGNGEIDSFVELFGNVTPLANGAISNHGYELLAELDEDGNGWVDRADDGFKYLMLWRDSNRNGISEPEELQPLTDSIVEGLSTSYRKSDLEDRAGNKFKYGSTARFLQGPVRETWDVFLASQAP